MKQDPVERLWFYANELFRAERRKRGKLYSMMEALIRSDRSIQWDDIVPEFTSIILDTTSEDKDYVALRAEMLWDTSDFYFRQKISYAFRTFIGRRLQLLRDRRSIIPLPDPEGPTITIEDKIMTTQMKALLTEEEKAVIAWRLKEISLDEALRRTGYKTKPSLYAMLKTIRQKVYHTDS